MGGRLALVIGSECDALNTLEFTGALATELYGELQRLGGWQPATSLDGPLLNPTVKQLKDSVTEAFDNASKHQATLLISFIGHGRKTQSNLFYLLAKDSNPEVRLDSDTGFNLGVSIVEKLGAAHLDGLIVLVDACESGSSAKSSEQWAEALDPRSGRIELLVATNDGSAYYGCFTKTMLKTFANGLPEHGTYLRPAAFRPPIAQACTRQLPVARSSAVGGDPGLWLVPNISRVGDAVFDRPSAGFVDQLTNVPTISPTLKKRAAMVHADNTHRLRTVIGPAGCGKSTLMGLLIRPSLLRVERPMFRMDAPFSSSYVTAAVFLDETSTLENFSEELRIQFTSRLDGYSEAAETVKKRFAYRDDIRPDRIEMEVMLPLGDVTPLFDHITIIIDGLDQPEKGARSQITAAIGELTRRNTLAHVRLIVGIREGTDIERSPELDSQSVHRIDAPSDYDIIRVVRQTHDLAPAQDGEPQWDDWLSALRTRTTAGGWLLARLMTEIRSLGDDDIRERVQLGTLIERRANDAITVSDPDTQGTTLALLGVLAAAGTGPVMPIDLLHSAANDLSTATPVAQLRDLIANLGVLLSRSNPGTPAERLGLAHLDFRAPIERHLERFGISVLNAHKAILVALEDSDTPSATRYAQSSAVRHFLAVGNSGAALRFLQSSDTGNAADNRDRWGSWLPLFGEILGWDHPHTLITRSNLGYWYGESGNITRAITEFEALLTCQLRDLGPDNLETLTTRGKLGRWQGEGGNPTRAITEFEALLAGQLRVLGPDHPETLTTRSNLGRWHGRSGNITRAITEFEALLADRLRVLGPDHPETLTTRSDLGRWHGESGNIARAITELEALLPDLFRVLGPDHPETLTTRSNLGYWYGESGNIARAITEFEALLPDQLRVLGPDHPETLTTRSNLGRWHGESGNIARAITELEALLPNRLRVLGPDHPHTLNTRGNLGRWQGESGNIARAITELEALLTDQLRVLGPDHPYTLDTRGNLGRWHGESGNIARAITELEALLTDQLRVLGPDHPRTLTTRNNVTYWRGRLTGTAQDIGN